MKDYLSLIDNLSIGEDLLSMNNITKVYSNGFVANQNVNFSIKKGEIHGLVGENGAGKSTLMKVLFGIETPEEGSIELLGENIEVKSPLNALEYGIGMVHQHFKLVESFTVAENMALGHEPSIGFAFDNQTAVENVNRVSKLYNLPIDATERVRNLSIGFKQRVEILKILLHGAKILLLDEPTALLTPQETEELFVQLINLKNEGFSIVFISHKLDELKRMCDRITILRRGKSIGTYGIEDLSESDISNLMVGKEIDLKVKKDKAKPGEVVLSVRNLFEQSRNGKVRLNKLNFDVREGEIVGVAAIEGNGQSELADVITGNRVIQQGTVTIKNTSIKGLDTKDIRRLNVSYVHEDRMSVSASPEQSVYTNLISDRYDTNEFSNFGLLNENKLIEHSTQLIDEFLIKTDSPFSSVKTLSGGNVQKVVVAREFSSNPELLVVSQPTRGIDVGAAELIRNKIVSLRDNYDSAILLFSADLTELLSVSDSIIVLFEGEIVAYFEDVSNVNEETLGEYMLGLKKQSEGELSEVVYSE